jgi:putative FmdB family regulatory protein
MPTYEYKCPSCGHKFEQFQSIMAAPIKRCPNCKKNKVQRLIGTGAGLIFKGSGFYITDYRSEGYKEKAKAEASGTSDAKPSDAKPAATSEKSSASSEAKPAASSKSEAPAAPKADAAPAPKAQPNQASSSAAKPKTRKR